jgi:2-polyprenyl-3-methyl-5-hydroxy-6-metoxy-1,4-benzoquinol methylase
MSSVAETVRHSEGARGKLSLVSRSIRWGFDRMLSVMYGVVYDGIFERFIPYRALQREVLELVESAVPADANRREIRILDIGCGPGNFTIELARAGFSVVGVDRYAPLIELAREKQRAKRLTNVTFQQVDFSGCTGFQGGAFDQIVNIHSLYVHPDPCRKLQQACRVLKPGGHAVFVNHTRRLGLLSTFFEVKRREGPGAALHCLRWVVPNSVFELTRTRVGPHYWGEDEFSAHLREAGFRLLAMRRTFLNGASLLAWASKETEE